MKYLCLCYYDTDAMARLTPEQQQEIGKPTLSNGPYLRGTRQAGAFFIRECELF